MSEASWEDEKRQSHEAKERALHARYQLLIVSDGRYGVITVSSWTELTNHEYAHFRFVPGLEQVRLATATRAAHLLNQGHMTEDHYKKN